jgi:FkbH-like protein
MPNGKIDRQSLANIEIAEYLNTDYQGPRNDFESKLVEIWKEILKVKRIGIDDNFFELGGHSISALQLNSRIHKKLNIKTEITFILQYPTIRKLSEALLRENSSDFNEILPLPKSEFYPLSHAQKRFWVMSHYKEGSEVYNESSVYTIEKDLYTEAFEQAFVEIIKRHEILRTVFVEVNNEPFQKVLEPEASLFKISHVDLRQNTESEKYIKEWLKKDIKLAFDLSNGPLMRATLFRVEDKKYQFAFNIHHIISDGWSKGLIIKEFLHFYKEITLGFKKQWQPLSIQYKDYAAWQLTTFNKEKQFWKQQFEDQVPVLDFPTDFERPKVLSFFGSTIQVHLSQNLTHSLRHLAIVNNMSVNNLMLALYGMLLSRYTGQKDVVLGTVASGRSHIDLEHLIGAFINFLPIRIKLDEEVKIGQYLSYVNEHLNEAYHNQDYPFDLIVEDVLKQRDISRNPMFDTMINFQLDNDLLSKGEFWENHFDEIGITVTPDQSLQENLFQSVLDMKMDVVPVDKMLHLNLSFNNKLFTETRMQDFLSQYVTLLEQVVDNPDKKLIEYGTWNLLKANNNSVNKQKALAVKVCSSFVMEPISEIFEYWNNELELNLELQFAPYNQIFQQLVDPSSLLNNNEGINVLFVRMEDWLRSKTFADVNAAIEYLQKTYDEFHNLLSAALARVNTHFIIAVLPVLNENRHDARLVNAIAILNTALVNFINSHSRLHRFDLEKMEALYGVENGYDAHSDEAGHMPFTPEYYATLGTFVARAIASYKGNPYKVIVLDCDNTLWHGVTGEAGALNVKINSGYQALQEFVISKYNEGFLLALCSKNNEADVWEVFEKNKSMVLTKEHIAAHRINWNPKADNIREIAKELNLGLSSFIFIDDNEFETEQVSLGCPDVLTLTLPEQPEEFMDYLNHIWEFDVFKITDEDLLRNEMYRTENRRKDELQNFESYDKFIESLEIEVGINPLSNEDLDRALQLTMRTNQFNLNGIRKTEAELLKSMANPKAVNWIIEVRDRFGDYGKVGLVLAHENGTQLKIDTFLLSCRVLGRHVEETILEKLNGYCLINGLQTIVANFIQTEKNIPFNDFLHRTGWELDNSGSAYTLNIKIRDQVNATIK